MCRRRTHVPRGAGRGRSRHRRVDRDGQGTGPADPRAARASDLCLIHRRAGEEPTLGNPAFFFRAAGWIVLNMVLIVAGAFIGGMLTPKVNPHNDWGATGMMYAL